MKTSSLKLLPLICQWSARILSSLLLAFFLFMLIGHLVPGGEPFGKLAFREAVGFGFLACIFGGYLLAWKCELVGALIGLVSVIAFGITIDFPITYLLLMASPSLLFVAADTLGDKHHPGISAAWILGLWLN